MRCGSADSPGSAIVSQLLLRASRLSRRPSIHTETNDLPNMMLKNVFNTEQNICAEAMPMEMPYRCSFVMNLTRSSKSAVLLFVSLALFLSFTVHSE